MTDPVIFITGPEVHDLAGFRPYHAAAAELLARGYGVHYPAAAGLQAPTPAELARTAPGVRQLLTQLADSDGLCLLPGWQQSVPAQSEVNLAELLQLDIRPLDDWLKTRTDRLASRG